MTVDSGTESGAVPPWRRLLTQSLVVVLSGVAAGLIGAAMVVLLHVVQILAYGPYGGSLAEEVAHASALRRVLAPTLGGLLAGFGWWWLRETGETVSLDAAIQDPERRMGVRRTTTDALLQLLVVGSGASIGREGAPRQTAAVVAEWIGRRFGLGSDQSRMIMAAAAGAGLAAVYNVPIAGAVFALEILLSRRTVGRVVSAFAMSAIATVTAWPVVTDRPVYAFPSTSAHPATVLWIVASVPVAALVGIVFDAMRRSAEAHRPRVGWRQPVAIMLAGLVVGLLSIPLPTLPGNGKDIMKLAFAGEGGVALFALLLLAKPIATVLYVRAGAVGGLLTPALATGAAVGALAAALFRSGGGDASIAVWALIGSAGVLAVTQRAPVFAAAMAWELTHAPLWTVPVLLAVSYGAVATARGIRRIRTRAPRRSPDREDPKDVARRP